jgi:peptidoglycan/LPS O-acetylase OafA/YrhL
MAGRLLVWVGTIWIVGVAVFFDWGYVEGRPGSWGDRTPLWLYAVSIPVLVAVAIGSTRRSPSRRVLVVTAFLASGVIAYAWAALTAKPPEILGMPEAGYVTGGALVLLAGLGMIWPTQHRTEYRATTRVSSLRETDEEKRGDRIARVTP